MAKKDNFKAVITDKDFFEDCIWMSYRYCIGRHTIAAAMHAADIAKYVHYLPKNRRQFMALDIRREISDRIHWRKNVTVEGFDPKQDALSLIYKHMMENPETKNDKDYHFYVNVNTCEVYSEKLQDSDKDTYYQSLLDDFIDYNNWIKLANFLDEDSYVTIKVNYENENMDLIGFSYIDVFQKEIRLLYTSVENYKKGPYKCSYIAPEYIKEIV